MWWYPPALKAGWHDGIFHVTDVMTTILALALRDGGNGDSDQGQGRRGAQRHDGSKAELGLDVDGHDLWDALSQQQPSPRTEVLLNINPRRDGQMSTPKAAIRVGDWKLVFEYWEEGAQGFDAPMLFSFAAGANANNISTRSRSRSLPAPGGYSGDVGETTNLAAKHPDVVQALKAKLDGYAAAMVPPYVPWPPFQGADYECCGCAETFVRATPAGVRAWLPWVSEAPTARNGSCATRCCPPFRKCVVPPCYGH